MRRAPAVVIVAVLAMSLPRPAGATSCDDSAEALAGILLMADAVTITANVVGIGVGMTHVGVGALGILTGAATLLNVGSLRDLCDPPSDTYINTVAVVGVASIIAGVGAIYWDTRYGVEIAPAPVMGKAGVVAGLTVRF